MPANPFSLPQAALEHIPAQAVQQIGRRAPIDTFATVSYEGLNGGQPVSGKFVEVDENTWSENGIFTFEEVSERPGFIELFDPSRNLTATIDLGTNDITISFGSNQVIYDVVDTSYSLAPVIPDGWLF